MNTELLEKVKAHILEEPRRFDMDLFGASGDKALEHSARNDRPAPPCGTVACIAGWALSLTGRPPSEWQGDDIEADADEVLGLSHDEGDRLFYTCEWPDEFRFAYRNADFKSDLTAAAEVAARRIDHFIQTNGAE